jgi:hypothetical protein
MLLPGTAQGASLHVVFPQTAEVSVVQGQTSPFTLEVQAFGATSCAATTAPVVINTLYSLDAAGAASSGQPADMPITTDQTRGTSENCDIHNPVLIPLRASAAAGTPVGDYTTVIRYGKGGDGDVDLDGPVLTIHVLPAPTVKPPPPLAPTVIVVLGERATPRPVLGKSVMLTLVSGTVRYTAPGQPLATLTDSVIVPNGTKVDTTEGVVKVTVVRDRTGALDSAAAWDGTFTASQGVDKAGLGLTTLTLSGTFKAAAKKVATAARKKKPNGLWVNGKGNFKTRGKRASAIVRGTEWFTGETARGTTVSVKRGLVAVRDFAHHKTVLVSQGHSYTATPPKRVIHRAPHFTG